MAVVGKCSSKMNHWEQIPHYGPHYLYQQEFKKRGIKAGVARGQSGDGRWLCDETSKIGAKWN